MLTRHQSGSWQHDGDPGEPSTRTPRLSVTDQEAALLARLAAGCRVLEIGTGLGVSTRALASTATSVVTIDVDPWVWETIWPTLPVNARGAAWVPDDEFDFAFIDGDHSTEATAADILAAERVVRAGGSIAIHDATYPDVAKALGAGWTHHATRHGIAVRVLE